MGSTLSYAAANEPNYIDITTNADALFDLGMVCASGAGGTVVDLVQAHKWFNLAALIGSEAAASARAEIACDMTARDIALAQKAARAFLSEHRVAA